MSRLSLPSKSGSKKKGLKPKEFFKKAERKGKESSALGPAGQLSYNLMDTYNHQALKTGSSQKAKVGAGQWVQPNPFGLVGYSPWGQESDTTEQLSTQVEGTALIFSTYPILFR